MSFQPAKLSVNWCDYAEVPETGSPKLNFFDMSLGKKVLLVGNGPSAVNASAVENQFDIVVRFNKFADHPNIGNRTDIWACCLNNDVIEWVCANSEKVSPKGVVLVQHDKSNEILAASSEKIRKAGLNVSAATEARETLRKQLGVNPTTGAVVAWHYIRNGYIPTLIGFDQIQGRYHKYWSQERITKFHSPEQESAWLTRMALEGKIVDLNPKATSGTKTIVGAWHVAMMNDWVPLVMEQESRLIKSGLLAKTDKVIVGIVGDDIEKWNMSPELSAKATIVRGRIEHYEHTTLEALHKEAMSSDDPFKAWYIHTKGVSGHGNKEAVRDWRLVMEYFVIDKFEDCIKVLDSCDACGVNRRTSPPHFSGNFWWANSSHLKKLPLIRPNDGRVVKEKIQLRGPEKERRYAELWVGMNSARLAGLHSCNAYYFSRYPENKYIT